MATSNVHKSEMTSSITTKRGTGKGNIAFSDVTLLKSLSTKHEARIGMEMVRFKNVETILLTYMFRQRYQILGNTNIIWETTCKLFVGKLP